MTKSSFQILNNAKQKIIEGDESLALSLLGRAYSENIPSSIVDLHKMTKGYMLLPMAEYSPVAYFECLKKVKKTADLHEQYREEYRNALETLINFKQMFLRDVAVNYFCEVSACSWGSNYGKSLDDLHMYIDKYIGEIIDKDCYGLAFYKPDYDIKKLKRDLLTVEAYALNLLLMYVTHKSTHYEGKSYYANAMDFGDYALVQVTSHDNYSHNAVARPRLHQVLKEAYYADYASKLKALSSELKISTSDDLKSEVSRLVDCRGAKNDSEKEYFNYAKRLAKDDLERSSFFNTFGGLVLGYKALVKPILKAALGAEEVGSFELDQPFTRKRWLGVCNMLAWANDWSVEMVRAIMFILGCMGIGVFVYFGLYLAQKVNFYLPNFSVEKHT